MDNKTMKISIKNLNMIYPKGKKALQNVSLEIKSPSLIGLLGPNGAGKSTLMKLLVGGLMPTSGEILIDGKPLLKNEKKLKANLGYLPQSFGLYDELTVWQFLDYMAALKGIKNSKKVIEEVINKTNLTEKRKARISTLSGGQRQRVGIAQALMGNPKLLIFDEPTVGLDPEERINFRNLFSKTAQDKIVLLSTHIIEDVQSVCDKLIVINHGQILFTGTPEELIALAHNHVGVFEEKAGESSDWEYKVTARVNTVKGIACRVVAEILPTFAEAVEPTLEDAYMYLIMGKEVK
ncbi:putative ABC transporter ATP-binding protein YxlF [Clostridium saccharobutylicum]|uniref:ABC transporter ATP-binding protein YxlF n=2 Tax=Clostridium saccharobutylicum TaxID=169679 RepID=U5MRC9_CLOSA|nr:ABC transporter ATP-binding protein YxlF [Clostridium saccharobutylicum DSM 13864]AQR89247.1 putative ABC transporter ATP-binding protein YxlF [Clostridium saccharobutylicum]AQR99148.1 putative ABC transporter ATP-binding protein YxlF [Clostridium saccharobutylicum]AQS08878.1 putative ABC transporter ATP-binding protein YxlF [Clostridium saccharobutylicum]AQS13136.1 putative ABC transporter ATP-binding protein YxlF [Clostridium saccharobutylicum]